MDEKFEHVNYSEFEPDQLKQELIDLYVGGRPWLLISAFSAEGGDLGMSIEAGGGLPYDLIENLLTKALIGFKQGQESIKGE